MQLEEFKVQLQKVMAEELQKIVFPVEPKVLLQRAPKSNLQGLL